MKPRLNFVTLGVADVKRAKAFYARLGLAEHGMSNDHIGFFNINGVVLAVFGQEALARDAGVEFKKEPMFRGVTLAWNGASEAEVDAIFGHARRCGATEVKKPEKVFWGGYSGYFADPDGHLWEVAYNPFITIGHEGRVQLP